MKRGGEARREGAGKPNCRMAVWLGIGIALSSVTGCRGPQPNQELIRFETTEAVMGTQFRIVVFDREEAHATRAMAAAFARIKEIERVFSDYDPRSEASRLHERSRGAPSDWVGVSDDMAQVLDRALFFAKITEGAFDPTLGPLSRLWRRSRRQGELPSTQRLKEALGAAGYQKIAWDPEKKQVRFLVERMRLDFGGIAKGFALDEALEVIKKSGIESALVDGGGDIAVLDPPPGTDGWVITLEGTSPKPGALVLSNQAIATSGDRYQFVEIEGKRYSHILDSKTGLGLSRPVVATVVADSGMNADALASAHCVMVVRGQEPLSSQDHRFAACWSFLDQEGWTTNETGGFSAFFTRR